MTSLASQLKVRCAGHVKVFIEDVLFGLSIQIQLTLNLIVVKISGKLGENLRMMRGEECNCYIKADMLAADYI